MKEPVLKVIFVTNVFDNAKNGPAMYAQYLWNAFKNHEKIDFHVVSSSFTEKHPNLHSAGRSKFSVFQYRKIAREASRLADKYESAIIHANAAHSVVGLLKYKERLVVQVNDYETANIWEHKRESFKYYGIRRFFSLLWRASQEQKILNNVYKVICNSRYTLQQIQYAYQLDALNCDVVYKAVDIAKFTKPMGIDRTDSMTYGKTNFLFIGSNWRTKGLDILLRAFSKISLKHKSANLIIVGDIKINFNHPMIVLAQQLKITKNVSFVGRKNAKELAAIMWSADIFVLPSRREAFGVVILEAMAAELPVIATNVGGIPEIISDGDRGLLVERDSVDQLATAMETLLTDKKKRQDIVRESKKAVEKFSVNEMIPQIYNLYLEHNS